ncbi:MAG: LolA family protein [Pirellulaceae bacterium]
MPTPKSSPTRFEESWFTLLANTNDATLIGEEPIADGSIAEHYRVESKDPELVFDVWIDPKSQSIIRVEFEETRPRASAEARGKYVISDIKSNQDFDPSLFGTKPPVGYEVTVVEEPAK